MRAYSLLALLVIRPILLAVDDDGSVLEAVIRELRRQQRHDLPGDARPPRSFAKTCFARRSSASAAARSLELVA